MERIQGLSGKTETISNVIIDELDSLAKRTQVIILSPTREAAQATHTLVSASAAASSIATHLSVGGNDIHKDRQRLKERPHVVIGTIGRIFSMLERKTINPCDIKFFCVEGIQYFLGTNYETQFAEFCEKLPKDTEVVFLSTKTRYKTPHDFSKFFTNQPLHFLVKEDPAPEPGATPCDLEPVGVGLSQSEETMQNAIKPVCIFIHYVRTGTLVTVRMSIIPRLLASKAEVLCPVSRTSRIHRQGSTRTGNATFPVFPGAF